MKTNQTQLTGMLSAAWRSFISLTTIFLLIEFFDEFIYGVDGAALPAQRADLGMDYLQVGLLLGLPQLINIFIEPMIMLLGDTRLRKRLVVGGGLAIVLALLLAAWAPTFTWLLVAMVVMFPASGAFVSLAQATLMDAHPGREAQMMARWVVSGSVANLVGPLFLAVLLTASLTWREAFISLAGLGLLLTLWTARQDFPAVAITTHEAAHSEPMRLAVWHEIRALVRGLGAAITNLGLLRWIILLATADLLGDIYTSYLPLYFTDMVGTSQTQTSLLLSLFMGAGLISDLVVVWLLERFPGRRVVRISAGIIAILFPAWLLVTGVPMKIILMVAIRLLGLGWYTVLMGEAFAAAAERKGTFMAINASLGGLLSSFFPWLVGWTAAQAGLQNAMWLLLLGPLSLLLLLPRKSPAG
jgi:MFS transporter, FSR family, fosmidomycin resistance protein